MSEVNLLTDEECEIVAELSKLPSLNLVGACHSYRYYGVDREGNEENIKILKDILVKWCPDLVSFSNFTGTEPNKIRIQCRYSPDFVGVHYLPLPNNDPEVLDV